MTCLYAKMQSACRKYHSSETGLILVVNDIQRAIDDQCESILVLLDLSPAFDTIDHAIYLELYNLSSSSVVHFLFC